LSTWPISLLGSPAHWPSGLVWQKSRGSRCQLLERILHRPARDGMAAALMRAGFPP
jgi:hypothetical protein